MFVTGSATPFDTKYESVTELFTLGIDVAWAMILGGAIIGILPALAAYFVTRKIFTTIRSRSKKLGGHNLKHDIT